MGGAWRWAGRRPAAAQREGRGGHGAQRQRTCRAGPRRPRPPGTHSTPAGEGIGAEQVLRNVLRGEASGHLRWRAQAAELRPPTRVHLHGGHAREEEDEEAVEVERVVGGHPQRGLQEEVVDLHQQKDDDGRGALRSSRRGKGGSEGGGRQGRGEAAVSGMLPPPLTHRPAAPRQARLDAALGGGEDGPLVVVPGVRGELEQALRSWCARERGHGEKGDEAVGAGSVQADSSRSRHLPAGGRPTERSRPTEQSSSGSRPRPPRTRLALASSEGCWLMPDQL